MERMLRKRKNNSDYEIDRELTGKFAIEKNAEYQEQIEQLEEENRKLKDEMDMAITHNLLLIKENKKLRADLAECECSFGFENDEVGYRKRECKKLKEEIRFLEQCLDNKEKVNKSLREKLNKAGLEEYGFFNEY